MQPTVKNIGAAFELCKPFAQDDVEDEQLLMNDKENYESINRM